jgi:hypothetical protein
MLAALSRSTAEKEEAALKRRQLKRRQTATSLVVATIFVMSTVLTAAGPLWAAGGGMFDRFRDPTDGAIDASDWLLNHRGALAVPIIITEPTIGYGGGASLLWFQRTKQDEFKAKENPGEPLGLPPSIPFLFGFGTENDTWGAGGGYFGVWLDDRIRYLGAAAYTSANLDFYVGGQSFDYTLEGEFVMQEIQFRLWESDFFLGPRFVFANLDSTFKADVGRLGSIKAKFNQKNSAFGVVARYDSRDNILAPSRGQELKVVGNFFSESFGGSTDFQALETQFTSYHTLPWNLYLGVRVAADFSFAEAPFYAEPYVKLRGVPAMRYQDERAGEGEFELRWNLYQRWSLLGFFGLGWTDGPRTDRDDPGAIPAGGGGFRYLIARLLGFQMGVDVATSKVDTTFYIQAGGSM